MKKYILYTLPLLLFAACKEDVVNLAPISSPSTAAFYKTSKDIENAINANYASLQGSGCASTEFMFGDLPSDDSQAVPALFAQGHGDFDSYTSRATGSSNLGSVSGRYSSSYTAISRANSILERIDAIAMDGTLKARYIGEAKFLRAFFYFQIVKVFGDVPLVLKEIKSPEEGYAYGREPAAKVYAQIEKDFAEAAAVLPNSYSGADVGRATKWAANGLLARVLMFEKKYADAAILLQPIIASGQYNLLPVYSDIFKSANGNNQEILFSVQYTPNSVAQGEGNPVMGSFNPPTGAAAAVIGFTGTNADQPTQDLFNAYQAGDTRRDASIAFATVGGLPAAYVQKYITPTITQPAENGTDWPVLRYADVLLMYAECQNEAGNSASALVEVNKVRQRAFGNALQNLQTTNPAIVATYVADDQAAIRNRILTERRLELCFEGLRFFDLVRTDRLVSVMNAYFTNYNVIQNGVILKINSNNRLFPIPQIQIDHNPSIMPQNPGY